MKQNATPTKKRTHSSVGIRSLLAQSSILYRAYVGAIELSGYCAYLQHPPTLPLSNHNNQKWNRNVEHYCSLNKFRKSAHFTCTSR